MASLATQGSAVRPASRHLLLEFAVMRIAMASRAGAVLESVGCNLGHNLRFLDRMTIRARNREMRALEGVAALLVKRDRKR